MQELISMVGLPASGKSTIAQQYNDKGYTILSSDQMRQELFGDVNNQENNTILFNALYRDARIKLSQGQNVVIDATNLSSKRRVSGLESILKNTKKDLIQLDRSNIHVVAEIVACPYNECIDRNKSRERKVPNSVIENMYKQWQTPMVQEGFDEIKLTYTSDTKFSMLFDFLKLMQVSQHNKNHNLTIGNHCRKVASQLKNKGGLYGAGLLHDTGKLFCMQFKDANGKSTKDAHYYGHESVSAYDSFFYTRENDAYVLRTSQLITWHMLPHRLETEKSIEKYKKFLGEKFWGDLMLLHEADKNGRE